MPSVEENLNVWDGFDWTEEGEEWSRLWGGSRAAWQASLFPRIHSYLPAKRGLEIAPGFGRWTEYLKDSCEELTLVDLTPRCIEHCRRRFAGETHIKYAVNDGKSLPMVADRSIDFAFSFDSLVHADADAIEGYVKELSRVLAADGVAFIHHSNAGEYKSYFSLMRKLPRGKNFLQRVGVTRDDSWRGLTVTAELFRQFCKTYGLHCNSQELISWTHSWPIDCLSVVTLPGSKRLRPTQIIENRQFYREVRYIGNWSKLYFDAGKNIKP